jgi:hypothetical protein
MSLEVTTQSAHVPSRLLWPRQAARFACPQWLYYRAQELERADEQRRSQRMGMSMISLPGLLDSKLGKALKSTHRLLKDTAVIAVVTIVLLLILNICCWYTLRRHPELTESPAARITREYNERFYARQAGLVTRWLAIKDDAEMQAFLVENTAHAQAANIYEDFTMFRPVPWHGRFFNFEEAGYRAVRDQGPWPPSPQFFNIFVFGGSTTMGIGPDWAAIPSYLQEKLSNWSGPGRPVKVYNFGRGAYFSTQERILFEQLLMSGYKPDGIVFIDGLNDFFYLDGKPSEWTRFRDVLPSPPPPSLPVTQPPFLERMRLHLIARLLFLQSTSTYRLAQVVAAELSPAPTPELPIYKPEATSPAALGATIDRYIETKRQVAAIAAAEHIRALFIWQPVPGYGYDLSHHIMLNPLYGLGGHERSGLGYPLMAARRGEMGNDFLYLADMQRERNDPLYMDAVHYNAMFCEEIASAIADSITRRWTGGPPIAAAN